MVLIISEDQDRDRGREEQKKGIEAQEVPSKNLVIFCTAPEDAMAGKNHIEVLQKIFLRNGYKVVTNLESNIPVGSDRKAIIQSMLERASHLVIILSADFLASGFHMVEIVEKAQKMGVTIIPINWQACHSADFIDSAKLIPPGIAIGLRTEGEQHQAWTEVSIALTDRIVRHDERTIKAGIHRDVTGVMEAKRMNQTPFPRNEYFTGREKELESIHKRITQNGTVMIHGLGGVGKTQLAIEYSYRNSNNYEYIVWMNMDSEESALESFKAIALEIGLCPESETREIMVAKTQRWLRDNKKYLLICDNVNESSIVRKLLPPQRSGHTIITSRSPHPTLPNFKLQPFDHQSGEAETFLLRKAGYPMDQASPENDRHRETAAILVRTLGRLPLAIRQAASYILETGISLEEYVRLYSDHGEALRKRKGDLDDDYPLSVSATLEISLERLQEQSPAAIEILRFCAFLYNGQIPRNILNGIAQNTLAANEAIAAISKLSLLDITPHSLSDGAVSMHPVVAEVIKDDLSEDERIHYATMAVEALNRIFPRSIAEAGSIKAYEVLFPQAYRAFANIKQYNLKGPIIMEFLEKLAEAVMETTNNVFLASSFAREAHELSLMSGRKEDIKAIIRFTLRESMRRLKETPSPGEQKVIANLTKEMENIIGDNNDTIATSNDALKIESHTENMLLLADLYMFQKRYDDAQKTLEKIAEFYEKAENDSLWNKVMPLLYLATIAAAKEDSEKIEKYLAEAKALFDKIGILDKEQENYHVIGSKGIRVLEQYGDTLLIAAYANGDSDNCKKARAIYEKILDMVKKQSSPNDPQCIEILKKIGRTHLRMTEGAQRKEYLAELHSAEEVFKQAIALAEKVYGDYHLVTAQLYILLAQCQFKQGKSEAKILFQKAFALYESMGEKDNIYYLSGLQTFRLTFKSAPKTRRALRKVAQKKPA